MELFAPSDLFETSKDSVYPDPAEYSYWKNYKARTFFVDYELEDSYEIMELGKMIIQMNIEEKDIPVEELKPIKIFVFSYGGDLAQGMSFCDICLASRIPIITVNMGISMSAGFLVLLAGSKRYCLKHSKGLVHSGSAGFRGTAEQIEQAQKDYKDTLEQMKGYILERTSIDEKLFNKNRSKDWYLSAEEQLQYHVVDEIITDISNI